MDEIKFVVPAHALSELRFVPKIGKYVAQIEFPNHPKTEFWLSEKQARALGEAFPERYSTKSYQAFVILALTEQGLRFIWSALNEVRARQMAERFGGAWGWPEDSKSVNNVD